MGNLYSDSPLMAYTSEIVSIMSFYSCIVFWFPSLYNYDSISANIFLLPWIYSISGPYTSSISLHINTIPTLELLQVRFYGQYIF